MLKKIKKEICVLLTVVLMVVLSGPALASAAEFQRAEVVALEALAPSKAALFSTIGKELSSGLNQALSARNIEVTDSTLIEFVEAGKHNATAIVVTNVEGRQITKDMLMAINENGEYQSLTGAEIATVTSNLYGGNGTVDPFGDSFEIRFMVSFYAYGYAGWSMGLVQPQTAMFIYYDDSELYDVFSVSMTYGCCGIEGYYTNGNFQAITDPLDFYRYDINLNKYNPNPRSYYSASDPFPSNKVIMMNGGPNGSGEHIVEYKIVAYRLSNNSRVTIEDDIFLDLG